MLRVVISFFRGDVVQMENILRWAIELNPEGANHNCLLSYEDGTDPTQMRLLAKQYFKGNIAENKYSTPPVAGWPAAPNWAWQSTARYIDDNKINEPWLWLESDAIPLKPDWLDAIHDAWKAGGRRFAGHIVDVMDHMNGVGVYPPDVRRRCNEAMLCRQAAWDVVLKATITNDCTNLNHLIQHVWNIRESDGAIWNGSGSPVTFPDWKAVEKYMDFNCVLLHRTKDGTLIQRLREKRSADRAAEEHKRTSVETNVPQFTRSESAVAIERVSQDIGPVEFLIVTYHKDLEWFRYCIRALRKFTTGFAGVTLAVPNRDKHLFKSLMLEHGFRLYGYDETEGKGMVEHFARMAMADQIVPKKTKWVAHLDADAIYKMETRPEDYFRNGKPVYMIRTYESLVDDNGVISDCAQWKPVAEAQLKTPVKYYAMCAFPFIYPVEMYPAYRAHIERVQGKPFLQYFLEGKNSFPQDRVDFQAMGQFAFDNFHDRFEWLDIGVNPPLKDRHSSFWSHAGVERYRAELDKILS